VVFPIAEANPTETVIALSALHMVTALILFDRFFAFRATFRVGHNPSHILAFGFTLVYPLSTIFTIARSMRLLRAEKTNWSAADALNSRCIVIG